MSFFNRSKDSTAIMALQKPTALTVPKNDTTCGKKDREVGNICSYVNCKYGILPRNGRTIKSLKKN